MSAKLFSLYRLNVLMAVCYLLLVIYGINTASSAIDENVLVWMFALLVPHLLFFMFALNPCVYVNVWAIFFYLGLFLIIVTYIAFTIYRSFIWPSSLPFTVLFAATTITTLIRFISRKHAN